jgi:hypothetical protein
VETFETKRYAFITPEIAKLRPYRRGVHAS